MSPFAERKPRSFAERKATLFDLPVLKQIACALACLAIALAATSAPAATFQSVGLYASVDQLNSWAAGLAADYPDIVRLHQFGWSSQNRPLWALEITEQAGTDDPSKPDFLFSGGVHAREVVGSQAAYSLASHLVTGYRDGDPACQAALRWRDVWILPMLNPDGRVSVETGNSQQRKNMQLYPSQSPTDSTRGVDLNRNFPHRWLDASDGAGDETYRGPYLLSAPEASALWALLHDQSKFGNLLSSIDFHSGASTVLSPWTSPNDTLNPPPPPVRAKLDSLAAAMGQITGLSTQKLGYDSYGTLVDSLYEEFGTYSFLEELYVGSGDIFSFFNPIDQVTMDATVNKAVASSMYLLSDQAFAVPEPSAWVLLATAAAMLACWRLVCPRLRPLWPVEDSRQWTVNVVGTLRNCAGWLGLSGEVAKWGRNCQRRIRLWEEVAVGRTRPHFGTSERCPSRASQPFRVPDVRHTECADYATVHCPQRHISGFAIALAAWLSAGRAQALVYTAVDLNPTGIVESYGYGAGGSQQVGWYQATGSTREHAVLWTGSPGTAIDLGASDLIQSYAWATNGTQQVGWGWGTSTGGRWHAILWNGAASPKIDLNPNSTFLRSAAVGISGNWQVGYGAGTTTGRGSHALLWNGTAASAADLHPAGFATSEAWGVSGSQQVGNGASTSAGGNPHALLWNGTAASAVDLHPAGHTMSYAWATNGVQQAGQAAGPATNYLPHAMFWSGTAASAVDLTPAGCYQSVARGLNSTFQVGFATGPATGNASHAMVWSGTADSAVDLDQFLPAGLTNSVASAIDSQGNIVGQAVDATGSVHAVLWRPVGGGPVISEAPTSPDSPSVPEPGTAALLAAVGAMGLAVRCRRRTS
jgi:hypothetical protein